MSIFFVTNEGNEIWNPASDTARLFCDQVASIARLLSVETGLGAIISDEVIVDAAQFKAFAAAFSGFMLRLQPDGKAWLLVAGCFSFVGALAERLGAQPVVEPELTRLIANGIRVIG